jgi:hypothetical protein
MTIVARWKIRGGDDLYFNRKKFECPIGKQLENNWQIICVLIALALNLSTQGPERDE